VAASCSKSSARDLLCIQIQGTYLRVVLTNWKGTFDGFSCMLVAESSEVTRLRLRLVLAVYSFSFCAHLQEIEDQHKVEGKKNGSGLADPKNRV
jgi:hypothetical protein